jgi:hypothetical protein
MFSHSIALIKATFLAFILVFNFSCNSSERGQKDTKTYFDLKGFVNEQITYLSARKPLVVKTLFADGKSEKHSSKEINWSRELELFVQSDINKPAYQKSYKVTRPDSLTYIYTLNAGETLPVQQLTISLDSTSKMPRTVRASVLSKNRLYESKKDIEFQCGAYSGKWSILSYRISGYQKLAVWDAKRFDIKGLIRF